MSDEEKLFVLVAAALSNSGTTASTPAGCATRAIAVARAALTQLTQLKEPNDPNH